MRFLLMLILLFVGYKIVKGFLATRKPADAPPPQQGEETYRDPVCGVYVAEDDAVIGRVEGERFFFCSMDCLEKYRERLEHQEQTTNPGGTP